jgi:hypothetical protein
MAKTTAPEQQNNPAEFTTCANCNMTRKLPEVCKCDRKSSIWK